MDLFERLEGNLNRFLLDMGKAGGGEQRQDACLCWTIGGSPIDYHNAVFRAQLADEDADQAIDEVISKFQLHGVPGSWHLTQTMMPDDLQQRLLSKGFNLGGDEAAMALDLTKWAPLPLSNGDLTIVEVETDDELEVWRVTLGSGFGAGPEEADWVASVYRTLGFGPTRPWHHYLAYRDGVPVSTMSTLEDDGTVGCYFVFTRKSYRKQGVASRLMSAALQQSKTRGSDLAVLAASPMGLRVYEQLGFSTCGRVGIFEYALPVPDEPSSP